MRFLPPAMSGEIIIDEAPFKLDHNSLLEKLPKKNCGAVVSFLGITRGQDNGEDIIRLEFDAWQEQLGTTLHKLAHLAIDKFGVSNIAMAHRTGSVAPEENIVSIHVASRHRKEAFVACEWLIDELKAQAPIWKKEVSKSGERWKQGLG